MNDNATVDDDTIVDILQTTRTIAMVGASPSPYRDSHAVMRYLQGAGYRVVPVNPTAVGQAIHGQPVVGSLADIDGSFELIDVFRRRDAVPGVVDDILPLVESCGIRTLWLQIGVGHRKAAARARDAGLRVVMDRCIKVEHRRLGFATSARPT